MSMKCHLILLVSMNYIFNLVSAQHKKEINQVDTNLGSMLGKDLIRINVTNHKTIQTIQSPIHIFSQKKIPRPQQSKIRKKDA